MKKNGGGREVMNFREKGAAHINIFFFYAEIVRSVFIKLHD